MLTKLLINTFKSEKDYTNALEWLIEVQDIFYPTLYSSIDAPKREYPLWLRDISTDGIQEVFKIYEHAKQSVEDTKKNLANCVDLLYKSQYT